MQPISCTYINVGNPYHDVGTHIVDMGTHINVCCDCCYHYSNFLIFQPKVIICHINRHHTKQHSKKKKNKKKKPKRRRPMVQCVNVVDWETNGLVVGPTALARSVSTNFWMSVVVVVKLFLKPMPRQALVTFSFKEPRDY